MKIPSWAQKYLKNDDPKRISQAIAEVEKKTSAEIVPVIVRESSYTGHVPMTVGLIVASFFMCLDFVLEMEGQFPWDGAWMIFLGQVLFVFALMRFLWFSPTIRRMLSDKNDLAWQTSMRAEIEFFRNDLKKTGGATGILIFVSLMERKALVLADHSISTKLHENIWQDVVKLLIDGIRRDDLAGGFVDAIQKCGELVTEHFPRANNDKNELSNRLIIKE